MKVLVVDKEIDAKALFEQRFRKELKTTRLNWNLLFLVKKVKKDNASIPNAKTTIFSNPTTRPSFTFNL